MPGKGISMVGRAAGNQTVYGGFQVSDRCDQRCIDRSGIRKADNTDAAARADLSILVPISCFINNIDEGFGTFLHTGKRSSAHAAGTIQHQNDVGGIF